MLYFIATPIGNLNDISLRSIDLLKNTNYIFAEDTRNTKKLLDFLDIKKKVQSFHEHNEKDITPKILSILKDKSDVVIVSDAGTPAISDPGYYLLTQWPRHSERALFRQSQQGQQEEDLRTVRWTTSHPQRHHQRKEIQSQVSSNSLITFDQKTFQPGREPKRPRP